MKKMHLFLIINALLGLFGLGCVIFITAHADTFPRFSPKIKWDISKKDSKITRAFSIPSNRSYAYAFILTFEIIDSERNISGVRSQLMDIVGDRYNSGGITIPLHIKVEILDVNKIGQEGTILDETVSTKGSLKSWKSQSRPENCKQTLGSRQIHSDRDHHRRNVSSRLDRDLLLHRAVRLL